MAARLRIGAGILVVGAVAVLLFVLSKDIRVSEEELTARVKACQPSWQNYQEDIKGQIGAGPVAEWEGHLVAAQLETGVVRATFQLSGPWANRDVAIPVLLHTASGETVSSSSARREGNRVEYRFELEASRAGDSTWLEFRYPFYGERRILLSEDGAWEEKEG